VYYSLLVLFNFKSLYVFKIFRFLGVDKNLSALDFVLGFISYLVLGP
jgi:hypothetical protein